MPYTLVKSWDCQYFSHSHRIQISKSINDCVQRAKNVIVFNLKEQDDKRKDKELVIYVPLSLEKKLHSNVLV